MYDPLSIVILVISAIVAFFLAFGLGANDVANSFGTSVGSRVLTLRQACILATIFETAGATFLGQKVSDSLRLTLIDSSIVFNSDIQIMLGALSSLIAAACWMIVATLYGLPISGTHSIVGAMVGNALVISGHNGINWWHLLLIACSWVTSPLLAGFVAICLFGIVQHFIKKSLNPLKRGLICFPFFFGGTIFINAISILRGGSTFLGLNKIPLWGVFVICLIFAISVGSMIWFFYIPRLHKNIEKLVKCEEETYSQNPNSISVNMDIMENEKNLQTSESQEFNGHINEYKIPVNILNDENGSLTNQSASVQRIICDERKTEIKSQDTIQIYQIFSKLQILTAIFGSFAHGANDVSNAIGPLITVWLIFFNDSITGKTPIYLLFAGGISISIGLWVLGKKVIYTMGEGLTIITPSSGFCIELGSALTVLLASHLGLPVSTTHCKVGAVMFMGAIQAQKVDYKLFTNIALAWLFTVPVTAGLSGIIMLIFVTFS